MRILRQVSLLIPAALLLAACSTDPNTMHRISFSATTGSAGGANGSAAVVADLIVTGTGGSVNISSAKIVLSKIKLASDSTCSAGDDDQHDVDEPDDEHDDDAQAADSSHDDHDDDGEEADSTHDNHEGEDEDGCEPVRAGPVVVDVPLDGTTKIFLDAFVPAGTYTGMRAKLGPGEDGFSVKVVGVFTDEGGTDHSFTFTSSMRAPIHEDFDAPVTVDANTQNLTIDVDVSSWFKDANGAIIDPTNPENQHAIEKAIRASFRAFEDDNHDGDDDHEDEDH